MFENRPFDVYSFPAILQFPHILRKFCLVWAPFVIDGRFVVSVPFFERRSCHIVVIGCKNLSFIDDVFGQTTSFEGTFSLVLAIAIALYRFFIHQLFLKRSNSLQTNCAVTYRDLMLTYLLVKNNYQQRPNAPIYTSWNKDSVKCRWTWKQNVDVNRFPYAIVYAECQDSCSDWCKPVKYLTTVLVRDGNEWKIQQKEITVAYVYSD